MPLIFGPELIRFCEQILIAASVPADTASLVATSLVAANLRAVDSHGVQLLPYYVEQLEWGDMDAQARGRVISESGSCLLYDGANGIGQQIADTCCHHAIRIARAQGMGLVVARESNHFGAAAFWAQKMSAAGQIGIVMCNASSLVPPWQGKQPRLGTNPLCMAVPGPWLLDMATTTVAAGKIYKAMINGQETIPPGWAMDAEGVPTTSTQAALKGLLMPLGGYKGSGLAMMAEILCAVLGGGAFCDEVGGIRKRGRPLRVSQMFLAIDVARFLPVEEFAARVGHLVAIMKSTPPAPGYDEVLVAGDPEWRAEAERRREGIPVGDGTWEMLLAAAGRLGVPAPDLSGPASPPASRVQ
ncbi:MAG TPA: Ldh family oxidoreductase [Bryobacteraceae bacterium]|nr:Ldh family oxidoreductase [Bryobacteraceae bacterium]